MKINRKFNEFISGNKKLKWNRKFKKKNAGSGKNVRNKNKGTVKTKKK